MMTSLRIEVTDHSTTLISSLIFFFKLVENQPGLPHRKMNIKAATCEILCCNDNIVTCYNNSKLFYNIISHS